MRVSAPFRAREASERIIELKMGNARKRSLYSWGNGLDNVELEMN